MHHYADILPSHAYRFVQELAGAKSIPSVLRRDIGSSYQLTLGQHGSHWLHVNSASNKISALQTIYHYKRTLSIVLSSVSQ